MTTFFIRHRVADVDKWREGYSEVAPVQKAAGVLEGAVYQSADDPKTLLIMHRFADAETGNAFFSNPDHQAIMGDLGVDASSVRIEVYED